MGEFRINYEGRRFTQPNTFHYEGARELWRRAFEGTGTSYTWTIGISGINIPNAFTRRPNHTYKLKNTPPALKLAPDTLYEHVRDSGGHMLGLANVDGTWDDVHRRVMNAYDAHPGSLDPKTVTLNVKSDRGAAVVESGLATFTNYARWYADDDPDDRADDPLWYKDHPLSNDQHVFPWNTPRIWPGETDKVATGRSPVYPIRDSNWYVIAFGVTPPTVVDQPSRWPPSSWGAWRLYIRGSAHTVNGFTSITDPSDPNAFIDVLSFDGYSANTFPNDSKAYYYTLRYETPTAQAINNNAWLESSLPVACVYLAADDKLVASARFIDDLVLHPGGTLAVEYWGRIRELVTKGPS